MWSLLISIFGLFLSDRFFCKLQKFQIISEKKRWMFYGLSVLPLFLVLIFKDPEVLIFIYIGCFLITFILFFLLFDQIMQKIFKNMKIQVLESIILQIRVGNSPQKAVFNVYQQFKPLEKIIFEPFLYIFLDQTSEKSIRCSFATDYFKELGFILTSQTRVIDQLLSFKDGLKIQENFRRKSKQVTQQIRAQAVVTFFVYVLMFVLSYTHLQLDKYPMIIIISIGMFTFGLISIFYMGRKIKWQV